MKRIWHHYEVWEDYQRGMWRTVSGAERATLLAQAIEFTGDAELYGSYMRRVIVEWPKACEHNLTDVGQNRKAWVGHASTCLAIDCPEDVTRQAWAHLSQQQQDEANAQAQAAIDEWEWQHETGNLGLHRKVGAARVSAGDTGSGRPQAGGARQMSLIPEDLHGDLEERRFAGELGIQQAANTCVHEHQAA